MHPQIEKYLFQVSRRLKSLSELQRAEEVRELEQHLQALVEEGREKGLDEGQSVRAALAQFGSSRKVGRELNQAVLSRAPGLLPRSISVVTFVMMGQTTLHLLSFGYWMWFIFSHHEVGTGNFPLVIGIKFFYWALTICLAVMLRQLRPWAFWLALLFLSRNAFLELIQMIKMVSETPRLLLFWIPSLAPTLFCLITLASNRKLYLQRASARLSG